MREAKCWWLPANQGTRNSSIQRLAPNCIREGATRLMQFSDGCPLDFALASDTGLEIQSVFFHEFNPQWAPSSTAGMSSNFRIRFFAQAERSNFLEQSHTSLFR